MAAIREMRERAGVKRGVKEADEDTEKKKKVRLPLFFVALWLGGSCRPEAVQSAAQSGKNSLLLTALMRTTSHLHLCVLFISCGASTRDHLVIGN